MCFIKRWLKIFKEQDCLSAQIEIWLCSAAPSPSTPLASKPLSVGQLLMICVFEDLQICWFLVMLTSLCLLSITFYFSRIHQ